MIILKEYDTSSIVNSFFMHDSLEVLVSSAGRALNCPILVIDDAFHVVAHYSTAGFSDSVFDGAVALGAVTYEASAILSSSPKLTKGMSDFFDLDDSPYRRRFAPLISSGIRFGYLICVDTDGHLEKIPTETYKIIENILGKQLFIEAGRQDKPFGTAEEILTHLLDGGFPSSSYFKLQTSSTYLANFRPIAFALISLKAYHSLYLGKGQLKDELTYHFYASHPFIYKGNVFMFLHKGYDMQKFYEIAEEFHLKVVISENISDLYDLPKLYETALEGLSVIEEASACKKNVFMTEELKPLIMLNSLSSCTNLIPEKILDLANYDNKKSSQYCETLYYYLASGHSLKQTCESLFTHRNTILYRIRKMTEDFELPLDVPEKHLELLLGVSLILYKHKGAQFFL